MRSFTDALESQYRRKKVDVRGDATYNDICNAQRNIQQTTDKLQTDVDEARARFKVDKENLDELRSHKAPNLYSLTQCFKMAGHKKNKTSFERMLDDMFAQMMQNIIKEEYISKMHSEREAAEKRLYESRKSMWEAEKRFKAANRAIDHEANRTEGRRVTSSMQAVYEAAIKADTMDDYEYEGGE